MLRRMLNNSQWAGVATGARKDGGRGRTAGDGMISVAAPRIGLTLTIPLGVASLLLSGTTVLADDGLERPGRPSDLAVAADAETLAHTSTWGWWMGLPTTKSVGECRALASCRQMRSRSRPTVRLSTSPNPVNESCDCRAATPPAAVRGSPGR